MNVYKFGGASVKDAEGIKNLVKIVKAASPKSLLIVVSAMDKTTNALENLTVAYINGGDTASIFDDIKAYHDSVLNTLFNDENHPVFNEVTNAFVEIEWILDEDPHDDYDFIYDQIVSVGELVSSKIVSAYLGFARIKNTWVDARNYIQTDNAYREALVDWEKSSLLIDNTLKAILQTEIAVTQGFIGSTSENFSTTLGREGSDYSAAIFATCLKADAVTIWKDVKGVLNADPKLFSDTIKFDELSYFEALEMTYYGATVIHPKTIKPLQNADIPLYVKPFNAHTESGTIIHTNASVLNSPAIIVKNNQALISLSTKDHSFITEQYLSDIYKCFAEAHIRLNMTQNSAISFSACFDWNENRFNRVLENLNPVYNLKYNTDLQLITVRHYNKETISKLTVNKTILLEQLSRNTAQMLIR